MSRAEIIAKLSTLLVSRFHVDKNLIQDENFNIMLTSNILKFDYILMVYLLYEVEGIFKIKIPKDMLDNYKFSTFNGVVDTIHTLTNKVA